MTAIEINKWVGAVLVGLLVWRGMDFVAELVYGEVAMLDEPVYVVERPVPDLTEPDPALVSPLPVLLAEADLDAGEREARKCVACHTFEAGGADRVGPNLWDIVGAPFAHIPGFNYSPALAERDDVWTYENLDAFLEDPRGFIPGTRMIFPGIAADQLRADVIAYLRTLSDDPAPLPEVAE